jgi:hypothetical protein
MFQRLKIFASALHTTGALQRSWFAGGTRSKDKDAKLNASGSPPASVLVSATFSHFGCRAWRR